MTLTDDALSAPVPAAAQDGLHRVFKRLADYMNRSILGQPQFVDLLLVAVIADGHLLVEGAPGLAKTKAIKALSKAIDCNEQRIQFTPDLCPLTSRARTSTDPRTAPSASSPARCSTISSSRTRSTRAPAKVQAALLEAMAERQVTVGGATYALPKLFLVMATQNPIEQEGTYPLPEAQLDRFLLHVKLDYPDIAAEREILRLVRGEAQGESVAFGEKVSQAVIFSARRQALATYMSEAVEEYLLQFVFATRQPALYGKDLAGLVEFGASPRGTIALDRCARAHGLAAGPRLCGARGRAGHPQAVLRHRILLNFEAQADGMTTDRFLDTLLARVPVA